MQQFAKLLIIVIVIILVSTNSVFAQNKIDKSYLITKDSIGFVKIGTPLKDIQNIAKEKGFSIKKNKELYVVLDQNKYPLITFSVFTSQPRKKPVRTIKTASSKFLLPSGVSLIKTPLSKLEEIYSKASIYRIAPRKDAPEFVEFQEWPFTETKVQGAYLIKYKHTLNKLGDEFGNIIPVGKYDNDFSLYTDEYRPETHIDSFLIEAIEPTIKLK